MRGGPALSSPHMKLIRVFWPGLAAATLSFAGCIAYVPSFSNQPVNGRIIARRDAELIVPGRTARAEVIRTLGPGYRESIRGSAMAYPWEMPAGYMVWAAMSREVAAAGKSSDFTTWHALFLQFDAHGVVKRKEYVRLRGGRTLDEQLDRWAGVIVPDTSEPVKPGTP
jgi:hypothetical protein